MVCNHKKSKEIYEYYSTSIYGCDECGLVFTDKRESVFDARSLYRAYYKNEIAGRFNFGIEYVIRLFRFFRAFKIFMVHSAAKSILDIGSGRGFTLYYLKKYYRYKKTVGTQISVHALDFSRNKLGLDIHDKDLLEINFGDTTFDIITMWHVLEHVAKPEEYIRKILHLLSKDGKLIIEVPNFNSWTRRFTGPYWFGLDLDYHTHFFKPESLSGLLKKQGFKIKTIHTFSLEYSTFISAQSFVSLFTRSNHLFFNYIQNGNFSPRLVFHIILFMLIAPASFLINILLYFSTKGEVLLAIAEKKQG